MVNGRAHTKSVINIAWQLTDVGPDDGGFVIVPGSQKSCYPMPQSVRVCNERAPIRHVQMRRGSVLFFLGGAVCHGAYRWEAESPRRTALFTYGARRPAPFYMALEESVSSWHPLPQPNNRVTGCLLQLIIVENPGADRRHGCKFPNVDRYVVVQQFTGRTTAVRHNAFQ